MKKKSISILGVVVSVLLLIIVAVTLTLNVLFSQHDTPKIFGNYIYMMESDSMEVKPQASVETTTTAEGEAEGTAETNAAPSIDTNASIHAKTAVICKTYDGVEPISKNNAVLCVLAPEDTSTDKDSEGMAIRRILNIASDEETGIMKYYPTTMQADTIGTEPAITKDSIRGICRYESAQMYQVVKFATSFTGILVLLALPCVLLVILLIVALVRRSAKNREDDAYAFEESYDELAGEDNYEDEEYMDDEFVNDAPRTSYQTRTGNTNTYNTNDFEAKRSSIAQNFERKAVNPNSAYQKAKTMQFKAQKDIPIPEMPYIQAPQENPYVGKYSAEAPASSVESFQMPSIQTEEQQQQQTYRGAHEAPSGSGSRTLRSSATSNFRKPNVDDIFGTDPLAAATRERSTATSRRTTTAASVPAETAQPKAAPAARSTRSSKGQYDNASVDDLLAMIESGKNRLK